MAKKEKKELDEVLTELDLQPEVEVKKLAPISADFGRADLNQLRDAVNELIARS